jgi:hypothetical protein
MDSNNNNNNNSNKSFGGSRTNKSGTTSDGNVGAVGAMLVAGTGLAEVILPVFGSFCGSRCRLVVVGVIGAVDVAASDHSSFSHVFRQRTVAARQEQRKNN